MTIRHATYEQIIEALRKTNLIFRDNIVFKRCDHEEAHRALTHRVTLTVMATRGPHNVTLPGTRLSASPFSTTKRGRGKRISAACWHAHGVFFYYLISLDPEAVILSGGSLAHPGSYHKISSKGGNWVDWNIGSAMYPIYMSDACECEEDPDLWNEIEHIMNGEMTSSTPARPSDPGTSQMHSFQRNGTYQRKLSDVHESASPGIGSESKLAQLALTVTQP